MTAASGSRTSIDIPGDGKVASSHRFLWAAMAALEAGMMAYAMGRVIFGPVSLSPHPVLWTGWVLVAMVTYWVLSAVALWPYLTSPVSVSARRPWFRSRLWAATLPFLLLSAGGLAMVQLRPDTAKALVWSLLSPIEPFPSLAVGLAVLALVLAKRTIGGPDLSGDRSLVSGLPVDLGIAAALVIVGLLQASIYVTPIGNAFLRSWAIADSIITGTAYPVTITEPPTFMAGGPPYIRDLPLFPLLLLASFGVLGHTTLAAHLPAFISSALFPLSLYLLLKQATGNRVVSLIFTAIVSLFPFFRVWVLNLPDPDPMMMTGLCLTGLFYLRAVAEPERTGRWFVAGAAGGLLSLIRSEGLLYAGFMTLVVLILRPGWGRLALFLAGLGLFVAPMIAVWVLNFGILWPQNFNGTLGIHYPVENLEILRAMDAFGIYGRGLGLDPLAAAVLLFVSLGSVLWGTGAATVRRPQFLALLVPGIGNFVSVFFTSPGVTNAAHFADFFRHASFGIPFMALASAYGAVVLFEMSRRSVPLRVAVNLVALLLVAAAVRESDILANPTATHRPGATQVLTTATHLSLNGIARHPLQLPLMTYHWNGEVTVAYPTFMKWPEGIQEYFGPLDISFDSNGRPFAYASAVGVLIALGFAAVGRAQERQRFQEGRQSTGGSNRKP